MWQDGRLYLANKKQKKEENVSGFSSFDDYNFWTKWSEPIITVFNPVHDKNSLLEEVYSGWGEGYDIGNGLVTEDGNDTAMAAAKHHLFESKFDQYQRIKTSGRFPLLLSVYEWIEDAVREIFYHHFIGADLYPDKYAHELEHISPEDIEIDIHESWVHITDNGGSHGTHVHPMSHFGFIYCIDKADCDIKNGSIVFDGDVETGFTGLGNFWRKNVFSVEIEDGMGIMFPAMLRHSANPYFTVDGNKRVVIACNVNVISEKYGGV